jgi:hypothetical protein
MNNNRQPNNNNRRRGRSNNNSGGNRPQGNNNNRNGFDYQNRIDNRARGNASQMLEKYKKLAADAQHNDDRVNAEYYLQFADHYFRVLADFKSRQDERQEERRPPRDEAREERYSARDDNSENDGSEESAATSEPSDSVRQTQADAQQDNRPARVDRKERTARPPRRHHSEEPRDENADAQAGLDLSVLPPSISLAPSDDDGSGDEPAKPVRKPRARRVKPSADNSIATAAE